MVESFLLAWRALVRGHVLSLLLASMGLIHLVVPSLVRSDGTSDGWREMFVRAVPGSVYIVTAIALLACACGLLSHERESNRLAQTIVRPVSAFAVAGGRLCALALVAALVLSLNSVLLLLRPGWTDCRHVFTPDLPSPALAAQAALVDYLNDPQTPERVKKAPRHTVLSLLANKELDRYDTIAAGKAYRWPFKVDDLRATAREGGSFSVRVRFATQFDLRSSVTGEFGLGNLKGSVSNCTQSVIEVPLVDGKGENPPDGSHEGLVFKNSGQTTVMLRPRRDLEILAPADSFGWNLFRGTFEMFSIIFVLCAFGLFLSSALSRPVALFTAFAALLVVTMAPSVVAQFPDELEVALSDRLGLWISRSVSAVSSTFTDLAPVADLATGRCIEWRELVHAAISNIVVMPGFLLAFSAFVIRRKPLR